MRRLLGGDDIIKHRARQLSINLLHCWVDTFELECLLTKIRESSTEQSVQLCEKAAGLYKGAFLPTDTGLNWAVSSRETLKNRLIRAIITAGRYYEQKGEWERAADYYTKGIETDSLTEEFYRRLMDCYLNLGNKANAVKTYKSCYSKLEAELGVEPSHETMAVYSSILQI